MQFSKGEVNRASQRLAALVRDGGQSALRHPDAEGDVEAVRWWRDEHVAPMLATYLVVVGATPSVEHDGIHVPWVTYRPKRLSTIADKLTREPGRLTDMADLGGVRSVVAAMDDVDTLVDELRGLLEIRRIRDWARHPRATGYRAVHLHVVQDGRMVEVQVRTTGQDLWANIVEEETRLSGLNYKAGQGDPRVLDFYARLADFLAVMELGESHPDLAERLARALVAAKGSITVPQFARIDL